MAETNQWRWQGSRGTWFALTTVAAVVVTTDWVASGAPPTKSAKVAKTPAEKAPEQPNKPSTKPIGPTAAPEFAADPCTVLPRHELVITDLSVVESSRATSNEAWSVVSLLGKRHGPWTFASLISNACPVDQNPSDFVKMFFETWMAATSSSTTDFLNTDGPTDPSAAAAETRTEAINAYFQSWPRLRNGDLDLARAPLRLLAITNRLDIHGGDAEQVQGRFVFCMLTPNGKPAHGTLIMEYGLPETGPHGESQTVEWWAAEWHKLSSMKLGSPEYLKQLESVTTAFAGRGVMPERPNGTALLQFRVGEQLAKTKMLKANPVWEFRAFTVDAESGQLVVSQLNRTPHFDYNLYHFDNSPSNRNIETLISFLTVNKTSLLNATYDDWFAQTDIELAAAAPADPSAHWLWKEPTPDGFTDEEWFAMNIKFFGGRTCNGCHVSADNKKSPDKFDFFSHIAPREAGQESRLSPLLHDVIYTLRIPNIQSILCPDIPGARRAPRTNADH